LLLTAGTIGNLKFQVQDNISAVVSEIDSCADNKEYETFLLEIIVKSTNHFGHDETFHLIRNPFSLNSSSAVNFVYNTGSKHSKCGTIFGNGQQSTGYWSAIEHDNLNVKITVCVDCSANVNIIGLPMMYQLGFCHCPRRGLVAY
jgi:hypothetical protein